MLVARDLGEHIVLIQEIQKRNQSNTGTRLINRFRCLLAKKDKKLDLNMFRSDLFTWFACIIVCDFQHVQF